MNYVRHRRSAQAVDDYRECYEREPRVTPYTTLGVVGYCFDSTVFTDCSNLNYSICYFNKQDC